jgi:hypothetical protein
LALRNRLAASQARGTCKQCGQAHGRGHFWPGDWPNRHKYGIKCTTCEPRAPGEREKVAGKGIYTDAFREFNDARTDTLAAQKFACGRCHAEKPSDGFWPRDLGARNNRALHCKVCQSVPPGERRAAAASRQYACTVCKVDKPRDAFWPKDLHKDSTPRGGLRCKTCNPEPPGQRQPGRLARSSSAGPTVGI